MLRQVHSTRDLQSVTDESSAASCLTCRLMIPKPAWEMAKNRARSHQVGRQKHSAKYLHEAGQLQHITLGGYTAYPYHWMSNQ